MSSGLIKLSLHAPQGVRNILNLAESTSFFDSKTPTLDTLDFHKLYNATHDISMIKMLRLNNLRKGDKTNYKEYLNKILRSKWLKSHEAPLAIGSAGIAGAAGLGYYLSKRKKQENAPVTAI